MRYNIAEIEQQIINQLKGIEKDGSSLHFPSTTNMDIRTHEGDVNPAVFQSAELMQGLIMQMPFIYVQYQGRKPIAINASKSEYRHELKFRLYVGTQALRTSRETQIVMYGYLQEIYDALHGKWLASSKLSIALNLKTMIKGKILSIDAPSGEVIEINTDVEHGFVTDDKVYISGVTDVTIANNTSNNPYWTITVTDTDTFTLNGSVGDGTSSAIQSGYYISALTNTELNEHTPLMQAEGNDESIVIATPSCKIYQTDYSIIMLA